MVNILKKRNSTSLDEKALKYSLIRGRNESLESFHKRVIKANSNMTQHKYKIQRSMEYATPMQGFEVFKITKSNPEEKILFSISETRVSIFLDGVNIYKNKLESVKFLKDLKADLDLIPNITAEVITEENWEYLKSTNLVQIDSKRTRLEFESIGNVMTLPDKEVENVQDSLGFFNENTTEESTIVASNQYAIEDGNVFHKYSEKLEEVFYEYEDFPLYLTWSPIRTFKINNKEFDDILKTRVKNNEAFGLIDDNTVVDNSETVEVLSQRGAKIINKMLEKHNTYWGE